VPLEDLTDAPVDDGGQCRPDRRVPVHPGGLPGHEVADSAGRPDHQQRIDLGARAASVLRAVYGHQARDHRVDQVDGARRQSATTSPAARSTSATPPPR
jgi:hypothetical protein